MLAPPAVRVPSARADFVQHHADGTVIIDTQSADDYAAPPIEGAPIDDEPSLCEPLGDIGIAQAITHGVAHRQGDHVVGKAVMGEGADGAVHEAAAAGIAPPALPAQPCVSIPPRSIAPAPYALHDQSFLNSS